MSKTLVIVRHGKSTWDYGSISDIDRPLKETGISNTLLVSQKLKKHGIVPDQIISSPANRALHTALIVARELQYPAENIVINSRIYSEMEDDIMNIIKTVTNIYQNIMIVGHNPVSTLLANKFLKQQVDNVPTSGAVVLSFNTSSWAEISNQNLVSESVFFPKNL